MNLLVLLRVAWQALRRNLSRSFLTMLGIIIGVGAVIASMAIGAGAQAASSKQIESIGANLIVVQPGSITGAGGLRLGLGARTTLTRADVRAIATTVTGVAAAAPYCLIRAQAVAGNLNWSTTIAGTTPAWLEVESWTVAEGRFFTNTEVSGAAKVAVLGSTVAANLFPSGGAVGKTIVVRNVPLRVIGVLTPKGQSALGQDQDDIIVIPVSTHQQRLTGHTWVNAALISASSPDTVAEVIDMTARLLRLRHGLYPGQPDDFTIRNIASVQQVWLAVFKTQALLLAAVAVISLVVGGIGIMNIMLVSVTERTREIGLRRAVGAQRRDILLQFLAEAVVLAASGGVLGIAFGVAASIVVASLGGWPLIVSGSSILLGFVSAALVGVVFGYYPARRASALDPIVALRYE